MELNRRFMMMCKGVFSHLYVDLTCTYNNQVIGSMCPPVLFHC